MQNAVATAEKAHASREKLVVAIGSLLAAAVLTLAKLLVGLWTHSLGILSEAAHSLLDLVAASATLWAVRMSARPADRRHTYGYGKFENLSALVVTILLLLMCAGIASEAVRRLWGEATHVEASRWAFLVVLLSILVDCWRSRALRRVARKYNSRALEADALHFSTDIWSSAVVLLGLVGVLAAEKLGRPWLWLARADTLAALAVAAIIVVVSLRLGKKSLDDLSDRIPDDLHDKVAEAASRVPGVQGVSQVRMRRSGAEVFADVTLSVGQAASFQQAHDIADRAAEAVRSVIPGADVVVHAEPAAGEELDLTTKVRVLAARHGLAAHAIRFYAEGGRRRLELHLEVRESLSLEEAHRQASQFEQHVRAEMPDLLEVVSHLEPAGDATAWIQAELADEAQVREALDAFFRQSALAAHLHQVKVLRAGGELLVSFHCRLAPATAITDAHEFTVRVEEFLRRRIPQVARVVIHVEPHKDR